MNDPTWDRAKKTHNSGVGEWDPNPQDPTPNQWKAIVSSTPRSHIASRGKAEGMKEICQLDVRREWQSKSCVGR